MYRDREHHLAAVERAEDVAASAADRRDRAVAARRDELIEAFKQRPLAAIVPCVHAASSETTAVIADELAGWVMETSLDADAVLGQAMFDATYRTALIEKYAAERASSDVTKWMGPAGFEEAAA